MEYSTYSDLLSAVQDAWRGHYSLPVLTSTLTAYEEQLSSLSEAPPSAASRAQVESRSVRIGDVTCDLRDSGDSTGQGRRTVDFILSLSQQLGIDEVDAVRLVRHASAEAALQPASSSSPAAPLSERALSLHFTRRYALLVSLLDLLLMHRNAAFPHELLIAVDQCVAALLRRGLLPHLLSLISSLAPRVGRTSEASLRGQLQQELLHLLRILLALTRKHDMSAADAALLLSSLQSLSTALLAAQQPAATAAALPASSLPASSLPSSAAGGTEATLHFTCFSLLTSLASTLESKLAHSLRQPQSASLSSSPQAAEADMKSFVTALSAQGGKEGAEGWSHQTFHALFLLCFSLFLRRVRPLHPELSMDELQLTNWLLLALSQDVAAFAALQRDFLCSELMAAESRREEVGQVWTELLTALVVHAAEELELLKDEERREGEVGNYYHFLCSLSLLCRLSPANVTALWAAPQVAELLDADLSDGSSSLLSSPLLPAYLSLLSSLTLEPSGVAALRVFELLRNTSAVSWSLIFGIFQQCINFYLPHAATAAASPPSSASAPSITARESSLLCSFLSLLTAVLFNPDVQLLLFRHSDFRALDRLFALLGCRIDTQLKASIVDALSAFARSAPAIAMQVWERLDRAAVLPRDDTAAAGAAAGGGAGGSLQGLHYDLEEVESVQRRYPLTIAFARLVLTLLSSAPLPSASLSHYVAFVTQTLFLSLSDRQYAQPMERWKLTEACCAVMLVCVDGGAEADDAPGAAGLGAGLVQQLMAGKEAMVKLLELLSRAYQLLEVEGATLGGGGEGRDGDGGWSADGSMLERGEEGMRAVEGSLATILRLLWEVLSREEDWLQRLGSLRGGDGSRRRRQQARCGPRRPPPPLPAVRLWSGAATAAALRRVVAIAISSRAAASSCIPRCCSPTQRPPQHPQQPAAHG